MVELQSCKLAIAQSLQSNRFAIAHLYHEEKVMDIHIHDCYEVYYSISGGKQFLIGNRYYPISPGDVFVINQYESHHLSQIDQMIHERIILSIHPDFLKRMSTDETDLSTCFTYREHDCSHVIHLNQSQQDRFRYYIHKIKMAEGFGSDILENYAFIELMIMLNKLFLQNCNQHQTENLSDNQYTKQVSEIIEYINQTISEPSSISNLAAHFYMSESYICRIFKADTGTTINKYLTARRISMAKSKLAEGLPATEVCSLCGFNDYSNFVKSFTKAVGISPKKYSKLSAS